MKVDNVIVDRFLRLLHEQHFMLGFSVQTELCTHPECGYAGCAPGNLLAIRRLPDGFVFIPEFESMDGSFELQKLFGPPRELVRSDCPAGPKAHYLERCHDWNLPSYEDLPPLSGDELIRTLQFEAPGGVLGKFPRRVQLNRDDLLGFERGDIDEAHCALSNLIARCQGNSEPVQALEEPIEVPTIYLDTSPMVEWRPLAFSGDRVGVHLAPDGALVPHGG
jgi:hypothetical protein